MTWGVLLKKLKESWEAFDLRQCGHNWFSISLVEKFPFLTGRPWERFRKLECSLVDPLHDPVEAAVASRFLKFAAILLLFFIRSE